MKKNSNTFKENTQASFILTTFNRASFLQQAINNVREFITEKDELIIIDGGSKDGSVEIIQQNLDIISFWISEKDEGEAHGYNKGIIMANGEIIKLITDDDYYYPNVMNECIKLMKQDKSIEILISAGNSYIVDGTTQSYPIFRGFKSNESLRKNNFSLVGTKISGQALFIRKNVITKIGLLNTEKKYVDVDYLSRIIKSNCKILYFGEILYNHYITKTSGCNSLQQDPRWRQELADTFFSLEKWDLLSKFENKTILYILKNPNPIIALKIAWILLISVLIKIKQLVKS